MRNSKENFYFVLLMLTYISSRSYKPSENEIRENAF